MFNKFKSFGKFTNRVQWYPHASKLILLILNVIMFSIAALLIFIMSYLRQVTISFEVGRREVDGPFGNMRK